MTSTYHSVDSPSIPCADPKTFRNVAFTIHGQELPGKYTREAFQATMREFTLYHQNLMFLAKQLLHDAVLYVNPLVSVDPASYRKHGAIQANKAIVGGKRPRRDADESTLDVEPYDHLEFPFSDGNEYKKRTIEETLVERSSSTRRDKQKELQRHERLSLYVKQERSVDDSIDLDTFLRVGDDAAQDNEGEGGEQGALDFDSDQELDIHGDVDNVFDLYVSDEEEEQFRPRFSSMSSTSMGASIRSSVVLGPPQDVDVRPKTRIPPQVHLARLEDKLHKFTQSLSMDKVFACTLAYRPHSPTDGMFRSAIDHRRCEEGAKKGKRIPLDDFDKRLGYRNRHPNPVTEIKSSFLGPSCASFVSFVALSGLYSMWEFE
ncbi:Protein kinase C conserved region 2 [Fragilaria crotonensis]|nr:Protein kinase C conserved region 2 [Fragilaria crotonensis]